MNLSNRITSAITEQRLSGRIWLYSNYHCNLACRYCLTESAPNTPQRALPPIKMIAVAKQAKELGFTGIGITGGEPFMLPYIIDVLDEISHALPITILTNGTLFQGKRLAQLTKLANRNIRLQISLDRPDPIKNDEMRGPENFAKVIQAVPLLIDKGFQVRIATTVKDQTPEEKQQLKKLITELGVPSQDHLIRKVVNRGRAITENLGEHAPLEKLAPELTISVDGAFWSPFAPTYLNNRLQTDLLLCRRTTPLAHPAKLLLDYIEQNPQSEKDQDATGFV